MDTQPPHNPSLQGLGDVEATRGDHRSALRLLGESLRIDREIGDTLFVAGVLGSLAEVASRQGNHLRAARLWGHDARLRADLGSMPPRRHGGRYDRNSEELQAIARKVLGLDRFEQSLAEGAAMDVDEILMDGR